MRAYDIALIVAGACIMVAPFLVAALLKRTWRRGAWRGLKWTGTAFVAAILVGVATLPPKDVLETEARARQEQAEASRAARESEQAAAAEAKRLAALATEDQRRKDAEELAARAERDKAENAAAAKADEERRQRELAEALAPKPMSRDAIGCRSRDANDRLGRIASTGDKEAFTKLATALVATSQCRIMKAGTKLYLEDTAVFSGALCGRPQGETSCYWLPIDITK